MRARSFTEPEGFIKSDSSGEVMVSVMSEKIKKYKVSFSAEVRCEVGSAVEVKE